MKKYIYPLALTATALFATACSDNEVDDIQNIPDSQKEMISFSLSDGTSQTRAGFTIAATKLAMRIQSTEKGNTDNNKYTLTVAEASKDDSPASESYSTVTFDGVYKRYWDDAHGRKSLLSVYAVAVPNGGSSIKNNNKTLEELLTPGDATNTWGTNAVNTIAWQVTTSEQTKNGDSETPSKTIDMEDLVYSNNIQAGGEDGVYRWNYSATTPNYDPSSTGATTHHNGPMLFFQQGMSDDNAATSPTTSDPGHFDKGHLKFKHALSRITITLVAGEGFTSKPFAFATGTNIKLLNMNVKGSLNIQTGVWTVPASEGTGDIVKMAKTTAETNAAGTYMAQVLPDYSFGKTSSTNVAEFTIDDNVYYVTQKMLFDALTYDKDGDGVYDQGDGDGALISKKDDSEIKMEQGKNYQFKITVNKKQIESITATLAPWVNVTAADQSMNNSHVQFTFASPSGTNCTVFQFYRLKEDLGEITTGSGYTAESFSGDYKTEGAATIDPMGTTGKYQATGWFYDNNKTAYHFRTLNPLAADENGSVDNDKSENVKNVDGKSVFTMTADVSPSGSEPKDYHWGAPMKSDPTSIESYKLDQGFKDCIYNGVTSTNSDLKITEIHMMSEVYVTLKTTTGTNKVDLSNAKVTLTQLSIQATVDMGTGLISPVQLSDEDSWLAVYQNTIAPSTYWATGHDSNKDETGQFACSVIPQPLVRSTSATPAVHEYVGITIETNDHNKYYVVKELSSLTANSVTGGHTVEEGVAINRWYPGHKYFYTFTITKKGIENITCVLTDWISVTAGNTNIGLES